MSFFRASGLLSTRLIEILLQEDNKRMPAILQNGLIISKRLTLFICVHHCWGGGGLKRDVFLFFLTLFFCFFFCGGGGGWKAELCELVQHLLFAS